MTVSYTSEVATCRGFGCFLKLLFRWKASIYKLVWLDLLCFLVVYYILNFTYRWGLNEEGQKIFEGVVAYCLKYSDFIPLSFVLGFYVSIVMTRWWSQWTTIPWPDSMAVYVSCNVHGLDERGRVMRRTIMRYVCLCITMVLTMISPKVKKRFPTLDHLIEAGLLQESEKKIMEDLNQKFPKHSKHWMPLVWAASIVTRARKEGRIRDDFAVKTLIDELNKFRASCGLLLSYDMISVPLVYTQVVTIAVYSYFATAVVARQWTRTYVVDSSGGILQAINNIDLYFPIFTCLQFFFYMGWLKVAESLINPFGDDDDDFEVSWMVDRDIQVSYLIVDEMHHNHPELIRDQYWDEKFPVELPYTVAAEKNRETVPLPSTAKLDIPPDQQLLTNPSSVKIDEMSANDDATSGIHFSAGSGSRSMKRKPSTMSITSNSVGNSAQPGTIQRTNSVTSVLRRIFSRDESVRNPGGLSGNEIDGSLKPETPMSESLIKRPIGGSMRITDQVIEELDEQNTITSAATKKDERGTIAGLFGPPPPSEPMNVPLNKNSRPFSHAPNVNGSNDYKPMGFLSSSAPVAWGEVKLSLSPAALSECQETPTTRMRNRLDSDIGPALSAAVSQLIAAEDETASLASSDGNSESDEFQSLKEAREKERAARYMRKLMARSVSAQQNVGMEGLDDIVLAELRRESQTHDGDASGPGSNFSTSPADP